MTKKTLFISDLHLEENQPDMVEQFIQLLNHCNTSVDALYILGDMFEAWIGDDENTPLHQTVITAMRKASEKGLRIYFTYGNRDFLVGKKFLRASGSQLIGAEEKIFLYGTPVLLMHGDTLCTRDVAYLKARKIGFNPFYQFLFLLLPLSTRKKIREKMRAKSAKHKKATAMEIMDVTQEEVERVMQKHDVKYLIHGHTHRPAFHQFFINGKEATRIVLPAWHGQGSVLVWHDNGMKELIEINKLTTQSF